MGAITINGKGSRDRTKNRLQYRKNREQIDMTKRDPETHLIRVKKLPGKTRYVYG
jgi:hypothetical protein